MSKQMYVNEYYPAFVMVIIHEDRLSALLPLFYSRLQETLHPFGRFHLAGRHCGGGVKVTQLYYVESKAEQLTRVRSLKEGWEGVSFL